MKDVSGDKLGIGAVGRIVLVRSGVMKEAQGAGVGRFLGEFSEPGDEAVVDDLL